MTVDRKHYFLNRYYERKEVLLNLLGNKCVDCDIIDELEFDHIDPTLKSFDITSNIFKPMEILLIELEKCQLRCKSCHKLKSDSEESTGHGQGLSGKRNCKCEPCRKRKAEYNKANVKKYMRF